MTDPYNLKLIGCWVDHMRSAVCSEVPSPRAPRYWKAIPVVAAKSDIFRGLHDLPKSSRASRIWGWRAPRGWTGLLEMENVTWEKTIRSHCTVHAWYQIDWLHHVQLQLQESLVVEVWVKNRLTETIASSHRTSRLFIFDHTRFGKVFSNSRSKVGSTVWKVSCVYLNLVWLHKASMVWKRLFQEPERKMVNQL